MDEECTQQATVKAKAVRKGQKVSIYGVVVQVTKREKWNSTQVKIHYQDCGNGMPHQSGLSKVFAGFQPAAFLDLEEVLEIF